MCFVVVCVFQEVYALHEVHCKWCLVVPSASWFTLWSDTFKLLRQYLFNFEHKVSFKFGELVGSSGQLANQQRKLKIPSAAILTISFIPVIKPTSVVFFPNSFQTQHTFMLIIETKFPPLLPYGLKYASHLLMIRYWEECVLWKDPGDNQQLGIHQKRSQQRHDNSQGKHAKSSQKAIKTLDYELEISITQ